jgi:hypothetical protein
MMKHIYIFVLMALAGCQQKEKSTNTAYSDSTKNKTDSIIDVSDATKQDTVSLSKTYANARFKNVTVEKVGANEFIIQGKGQIFEANFGWAIEDGHEELKKGHHMTDAGAPEWGSFKFKIEVQKKRPNSTLTLILFESSAMDGSRQHELPIALE